MTLTARGVRAATTAALGSVGANLARLLHDDHTSCASARSFGIATVRPVARLVATRDPRCRLFPRSAVSSSSSTYCSRHRVPSERAQHHARRASIGITAQVKCPARPVVRQFDAPAILRCVRVGAPSKSAVSAAASRMGLRAPTLARPPSQGRLEPEVDSMQRSSDPASHLEALRDQRPRGA